MAGENVGDLGRTPERVAIDMERGDLWVLQALAVFYGELPSVIARRAIHAFAEAVRRTPEYAEIIEAANRAAAEAPETKDVPDIDQYPNVEKLFPAGQPEIPET